MSNQFKFSVHEIDGLIYLREYGGKQKIFKTRKELADYISPRTIAQATPAAPPYPSNQASSWNINAANTAGLASKQFSMNNAYNANDLLAGQQFNANQQFDNYHHVPGRGYDSGKQSQKVEPKETDKPKKSADDKLYAFFSQAQAQGYQGRVLDYITAVKAARCFLNSQDSDNLQDDGK